MENARVLSMGSTGCMTLPKCKPEAWLLHSRPRPQTRADHMHGCVLSQPSRSLQKAHLRLRTASGVRGGSPDGSPVL